MLTRWFRRACYVLPVAVVGGTSASYYQGERKRLSFLQHSNSSTLSVFNDASRRRAVVIGAGVVGVSTAYALAKRGVQVVVIDSSSESAANCSLVAAGGMQRSNAVVDRQTFIDVAKSFLITSKSKAFFHLHWLQVMTDPHFIRWFFGFAYHSMRYSEGDDRAQKLKMMQNNMLKFTDWAIGQTIGIMKDLDITERCGFNSNGALKLLPGKDAAAMKPSKMSLEKTVPLNVDEIMKLEPCLEPLRPKIGSAQFETSSSMGDSQRFTIALTEQCQRLGVKFMFDTRVYALQTEEDKVTGILTDKGQIPLRGSDSLVVAAGSWTPKLLWGAGLYAPVYPMKGYTLIMDLPDEPEDESKLPHRIITNSIMYTSRLGNRVRMASMGEFGGWNTAPDPAVEKSFRAQALASQPYLADRIANTKVRCGLRPFVNDGVILLGRLPSLSNALVNVGPGFNGWKIAGGSGEVIAKLIVGEKGEIMETTAAFNPKDRVVKAPIWSRLCMSRWF